MERFSYIEFEWDEGNTHKNWLKHKVRQAECEDLFFNAPIIADVDQSLILYHEERKVAYGVTSEQRTLVVIFTVRQNKVRVISARDMHRKERRMYHEERKKTSSV